MIQIITGDPRPISQQILEGLRRKIAAGELAQGSRLPSVRGLALQLTVSLNTVAKAYRQLSAEGLIESRQGIGVFVCEPTRNGNDVCRKRPGTSSTRCCPSAWRTARSSSAWHRNSRRSNLESQ